jgi:hypothetical protein
MIYLFILLQLWLFNQVYEVMLIANVLFPLPKWHFFFVREKIVMKKWSCYYTFLVRWWGRLFQRDSAWRLWGMTMIVHECMLVHPSLCNSPLFFRKPSICRLKYPLLIERTVSQQSFHLDAYFGLWTNAGDWQQGQHLRMRQESLELAGKVCFFFHFARLPPDCDVFQ